IKSRDEEIKARDEEIKARDEEIKARDEEIKARDEEILNLSNKLKEKEEIIINKEKELLQTKKELIDIYNSTGFKYLLGPLWKILWPIKQFLKRIFFLEYFNNYFQKKYSLEKLYKIQYLNYIKTGKNSPFPERLTLMLTRRCNLDCEFCDQSYKFNQEMSLSDAIKIIDSAKKLNIKMLVITGGEPFLHPDLFKIVRYAKENGISVCITTNGTLIKDKINDIIDSNLDFLTISLDGFEETHDILRGVKGAFNKVMEGIRELRKNGYKNFSICFVVTNKNIKDLEKVYFFCKSKNISFDFWPVNSISPLYLKEKKDRDLFLKFIRKLRRKREISKEKFLYLIKSIDYFQGKSFNVRCLGLVKDICIDVDKKIYPCCLFGKRKATPDLGKVLQGDLHELWNSEQYYELRKSIYLDGCNNDDCYNIALEELMRITDLPFYLPYKAPLPTRVLLNVTIRCNLNCKHCDNWKIKNTDELTTQQWKNIILYLRRWIKHFDLIIGGGEPLMRDDIIELINFCAQNKLHNIILNTNGSLIDKKMADRILNSGLSVLNISLDGMNAQTHDYTRARKGVYQRVIEAIEYINAYRKDKNMDLIISTIIMETNIEQIPQLYDFVITKGLNGIYFLPLFQNFNSKYNPNWYLSSELWPKDFKKIDNLINWLINQKLKERSFIINSVKQLELIRDYYKDPLRNLDITCLVGSSMFSITEDGHILLCPMFEPIGNVLNDDLIRLWQSKQADKMRKRIKDCKRNCKILGCFSDV
ncbi:MAG: radical SAM protein, partial [Candidatus Omnitrophica bacterium]|nr:radical SAM protein [Candidatus Omnitrophota bacterium]